MRTTRRRAWLWWLTCCLAAAIPPCARAAERPPSVRDPLALAVVDSLASSPLTTPAELLDAAMRAADVEAFDVASGFLARLGAALEQAGDDAPRVLADLGDSTDPALLRRLGRTLGPHDPEALPLVRAIQMESARRQRDPEQLKQRAADLASDSADVRQAAAERLARAGTDALPAPRSPTPCGSCSSHGSRPCSRPVGIRSRCSTASLPSRCARH